MEKEELRHIKIVDSNEPEQIRQRLLELGWQQRRLQSGDYCFWSCQFDKVGITRKTISDCLSSLNETFGKQLEEMLETYQICIMLIEGAWRWTTDTGQLLTARGLERHVKKEVLNYILRWQMRGFILERTANVKDTILRLNELYALLQKPYSLSSKSKGYIDDRVLSLPSGTRGKTGEKVLETFGSIRAIANASSDNLLTIEGIGKKKAELIYNHFNRDTNRSLTTNL